MAGLVSFLSPCVLPVVPAYLGQLGAIAVADPGIAAGAVTTGPGGTAVAVVGPAARPLLTRRAKALVHAGAFVLGFGGVFTLLGVAAAYTFGELADAFPILRWIGGLLLIVLGLNTMGVLRLSVLARTWRPLDRAAARRNAGTSGSGIATRTPIGAFALGAVFAVGWTPCIGPTLGAILNLAALGPSPQATLLFAAYSLGLGIPFIALALALDSAPGLIRPLLRHARTIEIVGGALVVFIGLAILPIFDWLTFLASRFSFLWPQV